MRPRRWMQPATRGADPLASTATIATEDAARKSASRTGRLADPRRTSVPVLFVFLAPALAIYAGLTAYPAFRTIFDSLFTIEGLDRIFVGLANYHELLRDETF